MKTAINNFAIRTLIMVLLPLTTLGQLNEKFYQVTKDGEYQFTYWQDNEGAKAASHPVTTRTFFLEAKRVGLLPEEMSYREFLDLSKEEQQAMVEYAQQDIIAAMQREDEPINPVMLATEEQKPNRLKEDDNQQVDITTADKYPLAGVTEDFELEPIDDIQVEDLSAPEKEEESNKRLPWMVQAVTSPGSRYKIPEIHNPNRTNENLDDKDEVSWVVKLITDPRGESDVDLNYQAQAKREQMGDNTAVQDQDPLLAEVTTKDGTVHLFLIGGDDQDSKQTPWLKDMHVQANNNLPKKERLDEATLNRRVKLIGLLQALLTQTDDEIGKNYGQVFPGMDGKLYGTSNAELDEIIQSLIATRDEYFADADEEVNEIFDQLEALASAR